MCVLLLYSFSAFVCGVICPIMQYYVLYLLSPYSTTNLCFTFLYINSGAEVGIVCKCCGLSVLLYYICHICVFTSQEISEIVKQLCLHVYLASCVLHNDVAVLIC